ncbi:MAG TPA: cation transporter [Clostridiales bacterium]|nr:cation transporter [Clostridiales bacterium]
MAKAKFKCYCNGDDMDTHEHKASKHILVAFLLNLSFVFIEIIGGIYTNSIAILSDAVHDFGDCLALGCAWILEKVSEKKPDDHYTFGYKRYSLLSALITAVVLVAGAAAVIYSSVLRWMEPVEIKAKGMLIIAVLGVLVNGVAVLKTSRGHGANEKAISLHMLEDVLGWVAILVGSLLIWWLHIPWIDPLLSIVVSVFILFSALRNMRQVLAVLMEKAPKGFDSRGFQASLSQVKAVMGIHHLHVWTVDGNTPIVTVHATVRDSATLCETESIKNDIAACAKLFGISHITIQLDRESNGCFQETCYFEED